MTLSQAQKAIKAAGIACRFNPSDDEQCDDEFTLAPGVAVQISATRNGLMFVASVETGAGDDFGVIHGKLTRDPVKAAREALLLADA